MLTVESKASYSQCSFTSSNLQHLTLLFLRMRDSLVQTSTVKTYYEVQCEDGLFWACHNISYLFVMTCIQCWKKCDGFP